MVGSEDKSRVMDHSPGSSICGSHEYGMSWFLLLCSFGHQDLGLGLGNSVHCFDVTEPRRETMGCTLGS